MTEQDYHADLEEKGYTPAIAKTWAAGLTNSDHRHEKDLYVLILAGEMQVGLHGEELDLRPGDACEIPAGQTHGERVGPRGVSFLVASRAAG